MSTVGTLTGLIPTVAASGVVLGMSEATFGRYNKRAKKKSRRRRKKVTGPARFWV